MIPYKLQNLVYKWVEFSNFEKNQVILLKIWPYIAQLGICMGLLSNSAEAHPYENQTRVPALCAVWDEVMGWKWDMQSIGLLQVP